MPGIVIPSLAPYDSVEYTLNLARARLNDTISGLGGSIFADSNPATSVLFNAAWRKMQLYLANQGGALFEAEAILFGVPATTVITSAGEFTLGWSQISDGAVFYESPVLPKDMILPLKMWERQSGAGSQFVLLAQMLDGLRLTIPYGQHGQWEWRGDGIYTPGATVAVDFRLRYSRLLADLMGGATAPAQTPVPVVQGSDTLSLFLMAEWASSRNDGMSDTYTQKAETAANKLINREARQKQHTNIRRIPYSRRQF